VFPFVVAIVMISNSAWNTSKNSKDDLAVRSIPILEARRKRHYEDLGKIAVLKSLWVSQNREDIYA